MSVDIRVAQLLCSRLCHDLVGPSGAVNAGLELMAEMPDSDDDRDGPMGLIGRSADQMDRRLAFYRRAVGSGGGGNAGPGRLDLHEAKTLAANLMDGGRVSLNWSPDGKPSDIIYDRMAGDGAKILLNLLMLGMESLPRGGTLSVRFAELAGGIATALTAEGTGAVLKDETLSALKDKESVDLLTAHTVQAYFTGALVASLGVKLEIDTESKDSVKLAFLLS